jgi:hypothetical protein
MPLFVNITVAKPVVADGSSWNLWQKNLPNGQGRQLGNKGKQALAAVSA